MLHAVVMAGGSGTRFWPESRKSRSKQFLDLTGGGRMIEETIRRVLPIVPIENVWVVAGAKDSAHLSPPPLGIPAKNILLEPMGRNTAPAVAYAARAIMAVDPDAVLVALPADHAIAKEGAFRAIIRKGAALAAKNREFVVVGLTPTRPSTGYGYIETGKPTGKGAFGVKRFTEKPPISVARRFVKSGRYLWNAGIFVIRADAYLDKTARNLPDVAAGLDKAFADFGKKSFPRALAAAWKGLPSVSVDYGLLEKECDSVVLPSEFGWSDIGTWHSLHEFLAGPGENVAVGNILLSDCRNVLARSDRGVVAVLGMDDVIVVRHGDAVLVCPRDRSEEVKQIAEAILKDHPDHA